MNADAAVLLDPAPHPESRRIVGTLNRFGSGAIRFAQRHAVVVIPLERSERYTQRSPALRRLGVDVDAWPAPPAGLFVVEERAVYLRSSSPMTVAHEFGHALDCALGKGVYRSSIDPVVRSLFANARAFVTPYAATGLDEYFAEGLRAYVEANDSSSIWPNATRKRLRSVDPGLADYLGDLFARGFRA